MIFTVIIALEFERSLLVMAERDRGVVQVRTVILIALLAIVRKLMIVDLSAVSAEQLLALAAATLALGGVYWLVRDQDRREAVWSVFLSIVTIPLSPRPSRLDLQGYSEYVQRIRSGNSRMSFPSTKPPPFP